MDGVEGLGLDVEGLCSHPNRENSQSRKGVDTLDYLTSLDLMSRGL